MGRDLRIVNDSVNTVHPYIINKQVRDFAWYLIKQNIDLLFFLGGGSEKPVLFFGISFIGQRKILLRRASLSKIF